MYYKTGGDIYFDDVKIEDLSREFVKNNIAVVNQFPYIFNMSIRDNFKVIRPNITDDEIFDLCKLTNIYSVVKNLPQGLDTVIGENAFYGNEKLALVYIPNTVTSIADTFTGSQPANAVYIYTGKDASALSACTRLAGANVIDGNDYDPTTTYTGVNLVVG